MRGRMLLAVAAVVGMAAIVPAQQNETQPQKKHPYEITPEAGPWAICVTCFFDIIDSADYNPNQPRTSLARSLAIDFVTELRKDYHMFGYMYNRGDEERKEEEARIQKERRELIETYKKLGQPVPEKMWRKRYAHVQDQYMVLVGGFPDQDAAKKYLDGIRNLKPPSERFMNKMQLGMNPGPGQRRVEDSGYLSPFRTAFVVPNPTVPVKKPQVSPEEAAQMDLAQFNTHNPYNLLKYPGKWTLVVKAYRAPVQRWGLENRGVIQTVSHDANAARTLEAIGKQAEELAKLLRNPLLKFDSYVMHANEFSLVTVGLFDSPKDPRMLQLSESLSKLHIDPETLISPPQPMIVPKRR